MLSRSIRTIFLAFFLSPAVLFSQEFRGTISGIVTDPSGAPVVGASVAVTEISTGTLVSAKTDDKGEYTAPYLQPGDYQIEVRFAGFKDYTRKGVHISSGDKAAVDVKLEVGDSTQTVSVTADVPLVNSVNASVGQSITTREVENLPLNGGTPLALAALATGVIATGQPGLIHPFDAGAAAGWSIGGSPSQTNEILINGSPDATWDGRLAYSPPRDAVLEVKINAFDSDASFGHTGGGVLNQVLRSGTNSIHGTFFEQNQPNTTAANNFFNNKNNLGNPVTHYNQYGLTAGGPVYIPKVFNGHDKLFWFFAWESLKDSQPNTTFVTVPTAKERTGDFSDLLALGSQYQLYDPTTAVLTNGTVTRQPYKNNVIPPSQLNPVALAMLKFYPLPNITAARGDGFNNFGSTASTPDDYNNELGRVDYNMSDRNRMFVDVRRTGYTQSKNNYFNNISTGSLLTRNNLGSSLDDIITVTPNNVVDLRVNFTRLDETHPSPSAGFDPSTLGLPAYVNSNSTLQQLPYVTFSSNSGFQALGTNGANALPSQSLQFFGTWSTLHGNHSIKLGTDLRQYNLNVASYGSSVGNYDFSGNTYVRGASNSSSTVVLGQDFAQFLLGLPNKTVYDLNTSAAYYQHYYAGFVQDDWRIRPNLTVNLGIRFDHDSPYNEKYSRTINGFDPTIVSPLAQAAQAAYAASPSALLPANAFGVNGGITYPSTGDTSVYNTTSHLFSPRLGLAYTPSFGHGKTVLRAGFGMFTTPISIASLAITGAYSTNPILTQEGFSQSTTNTANATDVAPLFTLSNPFPGGIKQPAGASLGAATFAGQTVTFLDPNQKNAYSLRWNFNIQQQVGSNTVLEISYLGNHGVHLPVNVRQLNVIPRQYLSTLNSRDAALITTLNTSVANPFYGLNSAQGTSKTTTVAQILSAYPQYPIGEASGSAGLIEQNSHDGASYFESINVRLQKRLGNGLTVTGNYIHSKLIERVTWLNDTDAQPEKRISPFDHPDRLVAAFSYGLPLGRGQRFDVRSRWLNALAGNWTINGIYTYQVGAPLTWVNGSTSAPGDYLPYGTPLVLNNREVNDKAFNTSAFDTAAADQYQYHIRTFSTTFGNLRQDGINQFDSSVLKRFTLKERFALEIRAEAYNILNHPTFAAPNTQATNSQFGVISSQSNRPRTMMFGARVTY